MANEREFEKSIDDAVKEYEKRFRRNMQTAADVVANKAKQNVGVDTGALRADIKTEVVEKNGEVVGRVGNTLEYAIYHHQGTGIYASEGNGRKDVPWVYKDPKSGNFYKTSGTKANPYLRDAVESERTKVERLLGGG